MPKTSDASSVTRFRRVASNVVAGPAAKSTSFSPAEQLGVLAAMIQTSSEAQQIFPRNSILGTASWRTPHRQFTRFITGGGIEVSAPAPAPEPEPEPEPGPASDITLTAQGNGTRNTFVCKYTSSGDTVWATQLAGDTTFGSGFTDTQYGYDVDTDNSGNVYVIGTYTGGFKIYNKSGTTFGTLDNTTGTNDVYIVKYNTTGTAQWVTRISGTLSDIGQSIAVSGSGDVYVTGSYISNPITIFNANGSTFGTLDVTGTSTSDCFIVKYNTSGTAQWAARITGSSNEIGYGVVVDGSGNVYTTGSFGSNPISIFNADGSSFGTLARAGSSGTDVFIVKYNTSGVVQWTGRIASTGSEIGFSIGTDGSGNVYVTGQGGSGTVTAYNADTSAFTTTLTNVGAGDCFIVKYNSSGTVQWATKVASSAGSDIGNVISIDSSSNVYVAGQYGSEGYVTAYNSDGSVSDYTLANSGGTDAFVVKYNSSGTVQWATRINGTGTDIGLGIDVNSNGDIFVSGTYTAGPLTIYNADRSTFNDTFANSGSTNGFLVKYNSSGTSQWVARIFPVISNLTLNVGTDDNIYLTGGFTTSLSTITFKLSTTPSTPVVTTYDTLTLANGSSPTTLGDAFVAKYTTLGRLNWTARIGGVNSDGIGETIADVFGNIYVTAGTFRVGFPTSQIRIFNANGTTGAFLSLPSGPTVLVKYNSTGTFQWLLSFLRGVYLAADNSGNTYILHSTTGSSYTLNRQGNTVAFTTTFANASGNKALVARYTPTGQPSLIGYIELAEATTMFVDPSGNAYVIGYIADTVGTPIYNSNGSLAATIPYIEFYYGSFVVKYNSSGVAQWYAQQVSDDSQTTAATTVDTSGNVYIVGRYSGNFDMYNSDDTLGFSLAGEFGVTNVFIVKYNSSGIAQWVARIDIISFNAVRGIETDSSGNVYIVGSYDAYLGNTVYNANGSASGITLPVTSGDTAPYIVKYNSSGQAQWALRVGGDSFGSFGSSVKVDTEGNVYFSGGYTDSPLRFYDTSGNMLDTPSLPNSGNGDYFLAKYNSSGVLLWATRMDGTGSEDFYDLPISTDSSNNVIIAGNYTSNPITLRSVGF